MSKTLLVSLVSDQTIPNVQLIKEFENEATDYLFISTYGMEKKGCRNWIIQTTGIVALDPIIVDQFSFSDIQHKLQDFDFDIFERIIVNLTGGTKVMTIAASDFFKNKGAEIYYVTGKDQEYVKLFSMKRNGSNNLKCHISLHDYLSAYGFSHKKENELSGFSLEQSQKILKAYCKDDIMNHLEAMKFINSQRRRKISQPAFDNKIENYLKFIGYQPINERELSGKETLYLSGEWFEEYIGLSLKKELNLLNDDLFIGSVISKNLASDVINSTQNLLGDDANLSNDDFNNEMDVLFMYGNQFYSIECKSSIVAYKIVEKNGDKREKPYNILGETIYKSDSLQKRFGLFASTSIITTSDFKNYWKVDDKSKRNNKVREMEELINRANLSKIRLVDRNKIAGSKSVSELFNIKTSDHAN